jgi:hypothetical protein
MIGRAASLFALAFTLASPAQAAPAGEEARPSTVLILVLPSAEFRGDDATEAYATARSAIERGTTLDVLAPDTFTASSRDEAMRACAGDGACFARKVLEAAPVAASGYLLTISAGRLDEGVLLGLRLVDLRKKADVGKVGKELPPNVNVVRAIGDYISGVFPPSIWNQVASLSIEVSQENASVDVSGAKPYSCVSPGCRLARLRPGPYEISVAKQGYRRWTGRAQLEAGQAGSVKVELLPDEAALTASPLFWAAIGAGAIAAGVAGFFLLRPSDGPLALCIASKQTQCH